MYTPDITPTTPIRFLHPYKRKEVHKDKHPLCLMLDYSIFSKAPLFMPFYSIKCRNKQGLI